MDPFNDRALDELNDKIRSLSSYRLGIVNELRRVRQRIEDIGAEMVGVSTKILAEKKAIDDHLGRLGSFDGVRQQTLENIRELRKKAPLIEKTLERIAARAPRETIDTTAKRLRAIEWKLQTEPLSRAEEKELVAHVKELEVKLLRWRKAYATRQELVDLLLEIKSLKGRLDDLNRRREVLGPELTARRERLSIMIRTRDQLRGEREDLRNDLAELERALAEAEGRIQSFKESKRQLLERRRAQEADQRLKREKELLDDAKREAMAKLAQGKKLSLDELKLVFGEDQGESLK